MPKVIGGQFPVLATDVYKQVVGQLDFNMGAVVGIVPAAAGRHRLPDRPLGPAWQRADNPSGPPPMRRKPNRARDWLACCIAWPSPGVLLGLTGVAVWGSLITFWPYNLTPDPGELRASPISSPPAGALVWTSVRLATWSPSSARPAIFTIA